jgi:flavin-dependent dehydrogenase
MDDVIIVGAGPAGALAAMLLARAGARVRLFDRARFPRAKLCGDTLNPGAMQVLRAHLSISDVLDRSLPLDGMLLTGPDGIRVRGRYGNGVTGRAIARRELDAILVQQAVAAGAALDDGVSVSAPHLDTTGRVIGIRLTGRDGRSREHGARLVVAADGRESRLARAVGLLRHPARPRRWAIGGYFTGVEGLTTVGEMHIRHGHYIGVAPMPGAIANACLVVPDGPHPGALRDPTRTLTATLASDPELAPRFARARMVDGPHVLGPMAVDARAVGVPGMVVAGDAAGFIDPMTGDGLRFALAGAVIAARTAIDVLAGRLDVNEAPRRLAQMRHHAFSAKWRFNRALRAVVGSSIAVRVAALSAHVLPAAFEGMIRYAGDCRLATCELGQTFSPR